MAFLANGESDRVVYVGGEKEYQRYKQLGLQVSHLLSLPRPPQNQRRSARHEEGEEGHRRCQTHSIE